MTTPLHVFLMQSSLRPTSGSRYAKVDDVEEFENIASFDSPTAALRSKADTGLMTVNASNDPN